MKYFRSFIFLMAVFVLILSCADVRAEGPTMRKSSINIWLRNLEPKWIPQMSFKVNGPIPAGTNFIVDYILPGNKPWISVTLTSEETGKKGWYGYTRIGDDIPMEKGTLATGSIDFKIRTVNELEGTKETLFEGKFIVNKYKWNNDFWYYVDKDWQLPIGYLYGNWEDSQEYDKINKTPGVWVSVCLKGNAYETEAFLYYQGKKITSVGGSAPTPDTSPDPSSYMWNSGVWYAFQALWYNKDESANENTSFDLSKNPGDYEIKILQKGKLARVIQFTIGNDGKIVDNGFAAQVNNKSSWIFPVKVIDTGLEKYDKEAWKTGAFYGNPLDGFVAP